MPKPTPTSDVSLNLTIESDGAGYLLCWVSSDRSVAGDLWYQDLPDAELSATENFGVAKNQWQTVG